MALVQSFEDHTGEEDRRDEGGDKTDDQGRSEATDRPCTEVEEDDTGDDRREVRVEDSAEGIAITVGDSAGHALAVAQLFLDTLIDKHVRVNGHTEREDKTGDTREGEHGIERSEDTEREEAVDDECEVGDHTRDEAVSQAHVDHQEDKCDSEGDDTSLDRSLTEGRTDDVLLLDDDARLHLTRVQYVRQVIRFFDGEVPRDRGVATSDLVVDVRRRVDDTVEDDSDRAADAFLRQASPDLSTFLIHGHGDLRLSATEAVVVDVRLSRSDDVTREVGLHRAVRADSVQLIDIGELTRLGILDGLSTPEQGEVLRQEVIFSSQRQERVDLVAIAVLSETDGSTATASELEILREGINRSELRRSCCRSRSYESSAVVSRAVISGYRVSSYGDGASSWSTESEQTIAKASQIVSYFIKGIGAPELEVSTTLQKFAHTLGILDTRELDEDTTLTFETLEVRSDDTEAVDTRTQDIE